MSVDHVVEFCHQFKGRLDDIWIETVLDYVDYNESGVALEMLCDFLADHDVPISADEYHEAMRLAADMAFDLESPRYTYLKTLIG